MDGAWTDITCIVVPPPPRQSASKEERQRYSSYQRKATQICVKFYGSNDMYVCIMDAVQASPCVRACLY